MTRAAADGPSPVRQSGWFVWFTIQSVVFWLGWDAAASGAWIVTAYLTRRGFIGFFAASPLSSADWARAFTTEYLSGLRPVVSMATVAGLALLRKRETGAMRWAGPLIAACVVVLVLYLTTAPLVVAGPHHLQPVWYVPMVAVATWLGGFGALAAFGWLLRAAAPCVQPAMRRQLPDQSPRSTGVPGTSSDQLGAGRARRAGLAWWFLTWLVFVNAWDVAYNVCGLSVILLPDLLQGVGHLYVGTPSGAGNAASGGSVLPGLFKCTLGGVYVAAWQYCRVHTIVGGRRSWLIVTGAVATAALGVVALSIGPAPGWAYFFPWYLEVLLSGATTIAAVFVVDLFAASTAGALRQGLVTGWPLGASPWAKRFVYATGAVGVVVLSLQYALNLDRRAAYSAAPAVATGRRFTDTAPPSAAKGRDIWVNQRDGASLVYIPAGRFVMGHYDEHTETLSEYWIGQTPVTVAQFKRYCAATHRRMPEAPHFDPHWRMLDHPIVDVTWYDAMKYCKWAGGALPSEAQWERAARGRGGRLYPWGNQFDPNMVWGRQPAAGDLQATAPVGIYSIGDYGISDMGSNVRQWCMDWRNDDFWTDAGVLGPDRVNLKESTYHQRVVRGGTTGDSDGDAFLAGGFPAGLPPDIGDETTGFRYVVHAAP